jgi:hypothetical protein
MSTDGRLTRALGTRDLAVYYLSSLVGVGVLVVPGIALAKAGPASLLAWVERHVWHNRSADAPLVFLSIYWMPLEQPA